MSLAKSSRPKKLLIITSSGGGGLLQAAAAKEQEVLAQDPDTIVIRRDLLKDWMGKWFGTLCAAFWNGAQRRGSIRVQRFIQISHLLLAEYLFWPQIFLRSLYTIFKEDVDRVLDTQIIGTAAIVKALRIFNRKKKKQIHLEKIIVDLPTKKATHFFLPIKRLSQKDRKHIKLTTITPLLEEGQTEEEFWREHCKLPLEQICYEDVYVRQTFLQFKRKARSEEPIAIPIQYKSAQELQFLQNTFCRGSIQAKVFEKEIHFFVGAEDRVLTILLGSQPSKGATFSYVRQLLQLAKENPLPVPTHLFVFADDHKPMNSNLFRKIAEHIAQMKEYPKFFSVIPFSFQSDRAIAPLFYRSDVTITRSGGQTAMELMCVSSGEIWIHSETKKREPSLKDLLAGIPGWEAENAVYLQKVRGAQVVTPETFSPLAQKFFQSNKGRISAMQSSA